MTSPSSPIDDQGRIGRYRMNAQSKNAETDGFDPVGRGGSSLVFLVEQELSREHVITRALKVFSPTAEIVEKRRKMGETDGIHSFMAEIETISMLTHQNIVKIIDAGTAVNGSPFYVMEYVDGPTFESLMNNELSLMADDREYWSSIARADPFLILRIMQQICWALAYLHARRRFHFDLAPKNVFIRNVDGKPHVIIGDLGVSQYVPLPADITDPDSTISIAGTKAYTPSELERYRSKEPIPLHILATLAAHWDLFALGTFALNLIESWNLGRSRELDALKIICQRLITDRSLTADKTVGELDRLLPAHVLTAGVEELSSDAYGNRRYINLPLSPIPTSRRLREILDHPAVTRLQLVPQLLLYRSATPGGVHTVYEHLLGSYGIMLRCLNKLLSQPRFRASFSRKELEESLIAVLLDGVDKHPLDRILTQVDEVHQADRRANLEAILGTEHRENRPLGTIINERFPEVDMESVKDVLFGDRAALPPYQKLIWDLIHSSLNVRAMDYLVRDSYHTGITAGTGVDTQDLIDSLLWEESSDGLGIGRSGVFSAEHLLCARFWMFARLYWSSTNRSITAMLRHLVYEILRAGTVTRKYLSQSLMSLDEASALRRLGELWSETSEYGRQRSDIVSLLAEPRPRAYFPLTQRFARNWASAGGRARELVKKFDSLRAIDLENLRLDFARESSVMRSLESTAVLFDLPMMGSSLNFGEDTFVDIGGGRIVPLCDVSDICAVLPATFRDTCFRLRVFYHPDLSGDIERDLRRDVEKFIEERFSS
ncbi:MAG: protein kinase [Sphingomonadaceae bacterium]|nr:protein kinase [Sphingomonadaceae bacterium]